MSHLVQALDQPTEPQGNGLAHFNPMRGPRTNQVSKPWLSIAAASGFILGAVLLVVWPRSENLTETTEQPQLNTPLPASASEEEPALPPETEARPDTTKETAPSMSPTETADASLTLAVQPEPTAPVIVDDVLDSALPQPAPELSTEPTQQTVQATTTKVVANEVKEPTAAATASANENTSTIRTSSTTSVPEENRLSTVTLAANRWRAEVNQYLAIGEAERAEAALKQWIGAAPTSEEPRLMLAKIYINTELYRTAEPLIQPLTSSEGRALLGLIYEKTQRPALAAAVFEQLFRADPSQYRWLLFWSINAENSGQADLAIRLYQTYLAQFDGVDDRLSRFAQQRLDVLRRP